MENDDNVTLVDEIMSVDTNDDCGQTSCEEAASTSAAAPCGEGSSTSVHEVQPVEVSSDNPKIDLSIVKKEEEIPKTGFDNGLEVDQILEVSQVNSKLMFLVSWKNSPVSELLDSSLVYRKCPQAAVRFFLDRIKSSGIEL